MDKKIVVLIHPGLSYRKPIKYASERAKEIGAKLLLLSVVPEFNESEKIMVAIQEIGPYDKVTDNIEKDIVVFLERAVQYCLDHEITVETMVERGGIEDVIKHVVKDKNIRLVVMPTPTKEAHHSAFIDTIRQFAHNMLEHDLRCPVVSVLAI